MRYTKSMQNAPAPLLELIASWPAPAQHATWACRTLFHEIARENDLGRLSESLKWGQPAWRPEKPRTGSTLRLNWSPAAADHLAFYVDCKTDLAARMQDLYPTLPFNDGRRHIAIPLARPLPEKAIAHLAVMTFAYHRKRPVAG